MERIRLYIADTDETHIMRVKHCLSRYRTMQVIGQTANGSEAFRDILANPPDVLLLDIPLPGMDGIMLLKDLQRMRLCPTSIICTRFYSDICVQKACRYGASYILYKPMDYNRLPEIMLECHRSRRQAPAGKVPIEADPARDIRGKLAEMGIPASLTGSLYLTESLLRLREDGSLLRNLSKGLYAEIANSIHTTPSRVERCLRNAIAIAYARGPLQEHFSARPTNREFIEYMLENMDAPV